VVTLRTIRFNIQKFYMVQTFHLSVLCVSQKKTATFALHSIKRLVSKTEVESVYSAVRTESLYKTDTLLLQGLKSDYLLIKH
jgi:hypothetical protein